MTDTDLTDEEPTSRATVKIIRFFFKFRIFKALIADTRLELPSGSPIEKAMATFIERHGLTGVLAALVVILAFAGIAVWLLAVVIVGLFVSAAIVEFARNRSSKDDK